MMICVNWDQFKTSTTAADEHHLEQVREHLCTEQESLSDDIDIVEFLRDDSSRRLSHIEQVCDISPLVAFHRFWVGLNFEYLDRVTERGMYSDLVKSVVGGESQFKHHHKMRHLARNYQSVFHQFGRHPSPEMTSKIMQINVPISALYTIATCNISSVVRESLYALEAGQLFSCKEAEELVKSHKASRKLRRVVTPESWQTDSFEIKVDDTPIHCQIDQNHKSRHTSRLIFESDVLPTRKHEAPVVVAYKQTPEVYAKDFFTKYRQKMQAMCLVA